MIILRSPAAPEARMRELLSGYCDWPEMTRVVLPHYSLVRISDGRRHNSEESGHPSEAGAGAPRGPTGRRGRVPAERTRRGRRREGEGGSAGGTRRQMA